LLYFFQQQVTKVRHDPDCLHAQRIRSNEDFYKGWVLPKLRNYCEFKGWDQPIVTSLGEGVYSENTAAVEEENNSIDLISS